ncbi:MAG: acetyl-CoA carboxylase biotin carboxyl carrier protein [Actinomycetota bacterium]|jgi:acetyl-CoA carboxylase biotin carboxyl carrier protein|nr:acetyl-CoA carboxylase biotin carboxyl carrier protein [Actinomycetota bacterium]
MGLTSDDLRALLEAFEAATWQEMTVVDGPDRLHVSRRPGAVVDRVTGALASPAPSVPVTAPSIGIFHRAASPGEVVGPDDTVGMIDVFDIVRPVSAGVAGTIAAVLVDDGAMVEYGDALVVVSPEPQNH